MILSRGDTEELAHLYEAWRGKPPTIDALLEYRGLKP
jgi:peptidyl-dipeptidase Dcp